MPRQPRLDTPGALHHVMVRGIDRCAIFSTPVDYDDFVRRLGLMSAGEGMQVLGWALLPNHVHLLVRSGSVPLAAAMRRLLTGYAVVSIRGPVAECRMEQEGEIDGVRST